MKSRGSPAPHPTDPMFVMLKAMAKANEWDRSYIRDLNEVSKIAVRIRLVEDDHQIDEFDGRLHPPK